MASARRARRDSYSRRRIPARRLVRIPRQHFAARFRAQRRRPARARPAHRMGKGARPAGIRDPHRRPRVRPRALAESAAHRRLSQRRRRRVVGGRTPRPARLRALSVPAAGANRSRTRTALPLLAPMGVLRFRLPLARRRRLFRRTLARRRHQRTARRRLAFLGARPAERRIPAPLDRRLPSQRHPSLRLDGTART